MVLSDAKKLDLHEMKNLKHPDKEGYLISYNPATRQIIGEIKHMNAEEVRECVQKAEEAQKEWAKTTFDEVYLRLVLQLQP